uniref:Uncharacterized protein n=1 Tax=Sphaerodactylus townsendi TaxID=933632 RepID=A0ACB8FE70_9SAUR
MTGPTHGLLFERLNESNYVSWVEKMKCYLIREGLWKAAQKAPDMSGDLMMMKAFGMEGAKGFTCHHHPQPPVNNSISKDREVTSRPEMNAVKSQMNYTPVEPTNHLACEFASEGDSRTQTSATEKAVQEGPGKEAPCSGASVLQAYQKSQRWLLDTGSTEHIVT